MAQDFTLHTHTNQFDGKNTVAEMAQRAKDLGMSAIGISNHFIVHPDIKNTNFYPFAVRGGYSDIYMSSFVDALAKYRQHYAEIDRVERDMRMPVLRGMELDYFYNENWRHGIEYAIKVLRPDYLIGACHLVEYDGKLYNVHDMKNADPEMRDKLLGLYWQKVCDASASGLFTWMAHLDLPRKVGVGTSDKWRATEERVIKTLAQHNTPIEINMSLYPEPHPSYRILKMVSDTNVPVVISDDAHHVSQIGRHFDDAETLCAKLGISNRLSLQKILDFSQKTL